AKVTGNQNRILLKESDISAHMENAVIAIEDRRFYQHEGVDYRGIVRALSQDLLRRGAVQGGSTITQQFVKNALTAQSNRSVFQKLREAALAYHLERKWSKQKVLTQYLNSIYFGNGAYGVEAAARTYFGGGAAATDPATGLQSTSASTGGAGGLKERSARNLRPAQAALLAGIIASPSLYDPVDNPRTAKRRRNTVLARMRDQKMITASQYREGLTEALPSDRDVSPPRPESEQPYFTSWLTQQLVDRYKAPAVFSGGLDVQTTLDPELQAAAQKAIEGRLSGVGPSASLVAIENKTGKIRAMVGGTNYSTRPFNLATNGHRQPGSAFKPFTLIRALEDGVSPDATFSSQKKSLPIPGKPGEKFDVNNYNDSYAGVSSLAAATTTSDNSVYAELGLKTGTKRIASLAQKMGVRTKVSDNAAMTLGGLKDGLTPLELAYAYSTIANKGVRVSGSLAASPGGPVAIDSVKRSGRDDVSRRTSKRVFPEKVGEVAQQLLAGVVQDGTGKAAQIGEFAAGKTGTTENYGDAWFIGFNKELTVAVWVGYPERVKPMESEYHGGPVAGGTFPAEIWHDFMTSWISVRDRRDAERGTKPEPGAITTTPASPPIAPQGQSVAPPRTTPQQSTAPQQSPQAPGQRVPQQPARPAEPRRQTPAPQTRAPAPGSTPGRAAPQGGATPG
ncbi:MAG: transglycosylase domain-containing protein, partial [Thermoleophilaceae bacterium]